MGKFIKYLPKPNKLFQATSVSEDLKESDFYAFKFLGSDARRLDYDFAANEVGDNCIVPSISQEILSLSDHFIGNSGSTYSLSIQWIRNYRLKMYFNQTTLLGGQFLNEDSFFMSIYCIVLFILNI